MGKLTEMAVGRVDGVDKPAIRKRFVLVKSEDAQPVEKDYKGAATAVVEAIAKEGVAFSEETMELLKALVETLELDVEFAAKSEDDDDDSADGDDGDESTDDGDDESTDDGEDGDDGADADDVEKTYSADEVEGLVAKALAAAGVDVSKLAKSDSGSEDGTRALAVKKSKQPKAQDGEERTVRKGTGLYSNIINGDPVTPYSA